MKKKTLEEIHDRLCYVQDTDGDVFRVNWFRVDDALIDLIPVDAETLEDNGGKIRIPVAGLLSFYTLFDIELKGISA